MKTPLNTALLLTLASATARAQINAGALKPEPSLPFTITQVATFNLPWRIAFLPDGRMLITEKVGPVWLVSQQEGRSDAWRTLGCRAPDSRRASRSRRRGVDDRGRQSGRSVPCDAEVDVARRITDDQSDGRRRAPGAGVDSRAAQMAQPVVSASAPPRCLDGGDVDLLHRHHRLEGTLCLTATSRKRLG